ncbi:luciferase domain-containing protein [Pedobacter nototheniae]|uniref:luciferase domain-containing protein n=1 Tax=Pedobacter nototheniae TaxID=2488994 RepID=UPI001FE852C5|nr:luciferase family protein [Pedobacter nototheniae]
MFGFVVNRLGFLKSIPLAALVFDSGIKIWILLTKPEKLNWIDEIETEVLTWKDINVKLHKFGGTQFNLDKKEIGHVHSNGILDILFSKTVKKKLLEEGRVKDHHIFKKSGWISFYIERNEDVAYANYLLKMAYLYIRSTTIRNE